MITDFKAFVKFSIMSVVQKDEWEGYDHSSLCYISYMVIKVSTKPHELSKIKSPDKLTFDPVDQELSVDPSTWARAKGPALSSRYPG